MLFFYLILSLFGLLASGLNGHKLNLYKKPSQFSKYSSFCSQFSYFIQWVDHFKFSNNDLYVYEQRYILVDKYWQKGGPIFFYTGNEGDIEWFCQNTGFIWDIAPQFNAMVVFAEHRYYGSSMPFGNESFSQTNIKYLTSEQALADFAYLITSIKEHVDGAKDSAVITFGGSYGGMLSAWFRMKYPNLVDGAIAASAPIWQFLADCDSFSHVNTYAFEKANPKCPELIRLSWSAINTLPTSALSNIFHLCSPLKNTQDLKDWLIDIYGNLAMANYPYETNFLNPLPANPVSVICDEIVSTKNTTDPINLLKGIYTAVNTYLNYTGKANCFDIYADDTGQVDGYAWGYQTCTEFVFPMCTTGVNDMFEQSSWDINKYVSDCKRNYGVVPRDEWPVIYYPGKNIKSYSNIVFTNGDLDPWSSGGVLVNVTDKLPAYIINGGAHHLDLRGANVNDPDSVIQVRQAEVVHIQNWIRQHNEQIKNI